MRYASLISQYRASEVRAHAVAIMNPIAVGEYTSFTSASALARACASGVGAGDAMVAGAEMSESHTSFGEFVP